MTQPTLIDLLLQAFRQVAQEIITLLPLTILAVLILTITILIIRVVNRVFGRILQLVNIDDMISKTLKIELPFSTNNLIIALIDIGISATALLAIATLILEPGQIGLMREAIGYLARVLSVVVLTIFVFLMFTSVIERVRVETRLRGYILFILLILVTMMVLDLTALSEPAKVALLQGLSLGVGIAVGVFAAWFFFHEYLDRLTGITQTQNEKREGS